MEPSRRGSVTGVLALGAVAHVFRVQLHLDGDAVEAELGVQQVGGVPQHQLSVGALLWREVREQKETQRESLSLRDMVALRPFFIFLF